MAGPWYLVVGGAEVDIDATYGTITSGYWGFGLPPLTHNVMAQALTPGALLQSIKVQPRVLQLQITVMHSTIAAWHHIRNHLLNAVKPQGYGTETPVEIRYDGGGTKLSIFGYYDGGLEGAAPESPAGGEELAVRFICYDPFWYAAAATNTTLTASATVANANYLLRRTAGVWANISAAFNGYVWDIERATNGDIYIAGTFTDVGDANGDKIVKWNGSALSSLSTGLGAAACRALAAAPGGGVYVGGDFTDVGDANGDRIVKWTGSAWASLGTGISNGQVDAIAVGFDGAVYAGGTFTNFVDANGDYISKWDGTAWSSLGTGMGGTVKTLAVGLAGQIYAGGSFDTAGGVTCNGIAKWNGSAWGSMGSGVNVGGGEYISALALAPDGTLYAAGYFAAINGVTAANIAKWNGYTWAPLGAGLSGGGVTDLDVDNAGRLYAVGTFLTAGGVVTDDGIAMWNGSSWSHVDATLPGTTSVYAVLVTPDGTTLYTGYNTAGSAYAAAQTTVTNGGDAPAYPSLTITPTTAISPRVLYLRNETTGHTLYINYTLQPGETLTIELETGAKAITSSFFGNVIGRSLLPNSDLAEWCLAPGANSVSLYVADASVAATMTHTNTYWSPDKTAA